MILSFSDKYHTHWSLIWILKKQKIFLNSYMTMMSVLRTFHCKIVRFQYSYNQHGLCHTNTLLSLMGWLDWKIKKHLTKNSLIILLGTYESITGLKILLEHRNACILCNIKVMLLTWITFDRVVSNGLIHTLLQWRTSLQSCLEQYFHNDLVEYRWHANHTFA